MSAHAWPRALPGRGWLTPLRDSIVLDIVDPPVLAQKAARALHPAVGLSFTGIAIRDTSGLFAMHGVAGGRNEDVLRQIRVSPGQGLGGKVVSLRRPVLVTDYVNDPAITTHFRDLAVMESLGGMAAVPVIADGDIMAIIYAATRDATTIGERALAKLDDAAAGLADLFGVAVRHDQSIQQHAAAERFRIAEELHDTVGQMLFAIGSSARRLRPEDSSDAGSSAARRTPAEIGADIEGKADQASSQLREALRKLGPRTPEESLPVAVRLDVEEFSRSASVPAHLAMIGEPRGVSPDDACALLGVVREALHNVAKHAHASLVLVTLGYTSDAVHIAVQDDGRGLPPGFSLQSIPVRESGWGLPSLLRRVQQRGGTMEVRPGEQGGTTVRATLRIDST